MNKLLLLILLCFGLNASVVAAELRVGDDLPAITLKNQHDKPITVAADVQTLLFVVEKPAGEVLSGYLKKQPDDFLISKKAYFMADISGMPSMVIKMFALPTMRKRPWSALLGYSASELAFMPHQKDHVTVVKLKAGKVDEIMFVNNEAALAANF